MKSEEIDETIHRIREQLPAPAEPPGEEELAAASRDAASRYGLTLVTPHVDVKTDK